MSEKSKTDRDIPRYDMDIMERQVQLADQIIRAIQQQYERQTYDVMAFGGPLRQQFQRDIDIAGQLETPEQELVRERAGLGRGEAGAEIGLGLLGTEAMRVLEGQPLLPEQEELIRRSSEELLAAGESDIERAAGRGLEQLREELAPQLGLRPSDTPVLDRGARIMEEATRQKGQLGRNLRAQEASLRLNVPLETARIEAFRAPQLIGRGQEMASLQALLREQAFQNRLNLFTGTSNLGLGLASLAFPRPSGQSTGTSSSSFSPMGWAGLGIDLLGELK
jgi:hypothetical protein